KPPTGPSPCGSPGGPTEMGGMITGDGAPRPPSPNGSCAPAVRTPTGGPPAGAIGSGACAHADPAPAANAAIDPNIPFRMARSCSSRGGTRRPPADRSPDPATRVVVETSTDRTPPNPAATRTTHIVLLRGTIGTIAGPT